MPRKIKTVDVQHLIDQPLPLATKSYTVISNEFILDTIYEAVKNNGFSVKSEQFKCSWDGQIAQGALVIGSHTDDPDLEMLCTFCNSYNKRVRFNSNIGAHIKINDSYMINSNKCWNRKHTGTAKEEAEALIQDHFANAHAEFDAIKQNKDAMQPIDITKSEFGSIMGELLINDVLTIDQVGQAYKEYNSPSHAYPNGRHNLWTAYIILAKAIKSSHPTIWINSQIQLHTYFMVNYDLASFDAEEAESTTDEAVAVTESESEFVDPNQMSIDDVINEVVVNTEAITKEEVVETYGEDLTEEQFQQIELLKAPTDVNPHADIPLEEEGIAPWTDVDTEAVALPGSDFDADGENAQTEEVLNTAEEVYVEVAHYEGLNIGDCIEINDVYHEVLAKEVIEDVNYFKMKVVNVEDDSTEEPVTEEPVVELPMATEPQEMAETNLVAQEEELVTMPEPVVKIELPESVSEPTPTVEVEESEPLPTTDSNLNAEEVEEETETETAVETLVESNPARITIEKELEEIYGYKPEFTFTLEDDTYNIILESGESIALAVAYIEAIS